MHSPSPSPHQLFQSLWKAVDSGDPRNVLRLVDALLRALPSDHTLATAAVMELSRMAHRHGDQVIVEALTRLPGYDASFDRNAE